MKGKPYYRCTATRADYAVLAVVPSDLFERVNHRITNSLFSGRSGVSNQYLDFRTSGL
jgi:hypothetical protein